jgi:hypothetical protein
MTSTGAEASTPPRRRKGYWLPGAIALTVLLVIALALGAGDLDHSSPATLHGSDVAREIGLGMQAEQGGHAPADVRCPPSEPVRAGWQFACSTERSGLTRTVQVTEIDGRGHLRWRLGP